jgi:hypothetical protein
MNGLEQIGIAVFGVTAIFLSQAADEKHRRWACIFGIAGQPFWFYTAIVNQQWGVFALCFLYSWAWFKGVRTYWWRVKA